MQFPYPCLKCALELGTLNSEDINYIEVHDGVLYEGQCKRGHKVRATLDQFHYEILFEVAIHAIMDGYYREAVTNFTASLERLFEAFCKITLIRSVKVYNLIDDAWKQVNNQSERQLGGFIFLYLMNFNEVPLFLSNNQMSFRNDVIHKGKIPTKNETIEYGNEVLKVIYPILSKLSTNFKKEIDLYAEVLRVKAIGYKKDDQLLRVRSIMFDFCLNFW